MFDDLTNLGYGLVVFAVIIAVGTIVLVNFGGAVGCTSPWIFNSSMGNCTEVGNISNSTAATGLGYTNTFYLTGQLGASGLAGWTPAIIAITIGLLFLGAFMVQDGKKGRY